MMRRGEGIRPAQADTGFDGSDIGLFSDDAKAHPPATGSAPPILGYRDRAARPEDRTTPPTDPDEHNWRIRLLKLRVRDLLVELFDLLGQQPDDPLFS